MSGRGWPTDLLLAWVGIGLVVAVVAYVSAVIARHRERRRAHGPRVTVWIDNHVLDQHGAPVRLEQWQRELLNDVEPKTICDECGGVWPLDQLYAGTIRGVGARLCESCCSTHRRWVT